MLQDGELENLESRLNAYRIENARANFSLEELLSRYERLLDEYRALKGSRDSEDNGWVTPRSRGPQGSRSAAHSNGEHMGADFVVVLIDGNHLLFQDDFIKARYEGGVRAGEALNTAVRKIIARTEYENASVVVRMYADLASLSKVLSKAHMVGPERRSMAPFFAGFTNKHELFDFVDAGDDILATKGKIKEQLRLFSGNSQCRHIIFAGCRDIDYLQMLIPHRNNPDRVTLVRTTEDHPQFSKLGLRQEFLHSVFRAHPLDIKLDDGYPLKSSTAYWANAAPTRSPAPERKLERFKPGPPTSPRATHKSSGTTFFSTTPENADKVPVNENGERLDSFIPKSRADEWSEFSRKCKDRKFCNDLHLKQTCPRGDDCPFDHSPSPPELINVLRWVARSIPCPRKGQCRDASCYMGHVCMKPGCTGPGKGCRLGKAMHGVDRRLANWVPGEGSGKALVSSSAHDEEPTIASPSSPTWHGVGLVDTYSDSTASEGGGYRPYGWDGTTEQEGLSWEQGQPLQGSSWDSMPAANQGVKW